MEYSYSIICRIYFFIGERERRVIIIVMRGKREVKVVYDCLVLV